MAVEIVALLLAVCFLGAQAQAQGTKDVPAPAPSDRLDEISGHAAQFRKTFTQQMEQLASAKNTDDFVKVLKDNTDTILAQVSQLSTSFGKALEDTNSKAKSALVEASARLEATVADMKRRRPQVEQQSKEFADKIKTAVQNSVRESDRLAELARDNAGEFGDKIAPALKQAYDTFVRQAEEVQQRIQEAANKNTTP